MIGEAARLRKGRLETGQQDVILPHKAAWEATNEQY
jgi:hypothetical protein